MSTKSSKSKGLLSTPVYKKRVVIAIDFGSTHCGIAYALVNFSSALDPTLDDYSNLVERPEIFAKVWREKYDKVPNCALLQKETGKVLQFGFDASETYLELVANEDDAELDDCLFFEGRDIKMRLWEKVQAFDKIEVKAQDGRGYLPLTVIISSILGHLKDEALQLASKGLPEILDASEALWVLTVPSIWQEADKQFMRRAAFMAGMTANAESTDLVLALEPECAIIAAGESGKEFSVGDKILTLDCGGGTVDICAVEVKSPWKRKKEDENTEGLRLRHLIEPCGGNWGATYIDKKFQDFVEIFLKDPQLSKLRATDPASVIELMNEFEALKTSITFKEYIECKGTRSLNMSNVMYAINEDHKENKNWGEFYGKDERDLTLEPQEAVEVKEKVELSDILDEYKARAEISKTKQPDLDLSYVDGLQARSNGFIGNDLVLPMKLIASFFDRVITKILSEVVDLMEHAELQGLKYILLVGGFAECEVLQELIKKKVKEKDSKIEVLLPLHPSTVVQKGAVQYGFDPNIISTRRARQTIGVKVTMKLSDLEKIDPDLAEDKERLEKHIVVKKREKYVKNVFNVFITKGQEISTSQIITRTFKAPAGKDNKVKFDIYATDDIDPKFITDKGCTKLASLQINVKKGQQPIFEYMMCFASTEIIAKVKNKETGESKELLLLFNNILDGNGTVDSEDSLVAVKIREINVWGGTVFNISNLDEREQVKKGGVSEML